MINLTINDPIADAITDYYGERCPDFSDTCPCCTTWAQYDALRSKGEAIGVEKLRGLLIYEMSRDPREGSDIWTDTAESILSALTVTDAMAEREARVSWHPPEILPPVPKGQEQYFIVAVRRGSSGKVWTFPATYLNAYPLEFNVCECDAEHSEDGCPCTGWYTVSSDGEYEDNYTQLLSPVDELVAWSEIQVHPLDPRAASTKGSDA